MALVIQILGQGSPSAGGTVDLCSPGGSESYLVSVIDVCNTAASATTFRIYSRKSGAAIGVGTASHYDTPIGAKETVQIRTAYTIGGAAGDVLSVGAAATGVTFTAHGTKVS